MIQLKPSNITGCYELQPNIMEDVRGRFVKVFHEPFYASLGLKTHFSEEYYSVSHKNVVRGLHFQLPPMDHVKLVYCVAGEVLDVVVDIRKDSPTYGQFEMFQLSAAKANAVYIPKGLAHGFCATSETAIMVYKVGTVYSPEHDAGILWNSVGIPWPTSTAVLSERDKIFPRLDQFESPFRL